MHRATDPDWSGLIERWKGEQIETRRRLRVCPLDPLPRFIAGADAAFPAGRNEVIAAAVVYDRHNRAVVETAHACLPLEVPYVPGFLAFREGPAILEALARLRHPFGAVLFDGHGYAHPRRCGVASYLAVKLDCPGVGVAKSRLVGQWQQPGPLPGDSSPLTDGGEQIGLVLRTRRNVRPLFISIGHRVDLPSAARLVLACCTRYRLPEPTRQADLTVRRLAAGRG